MVNNLNQLRDADRVFRSIFEGMPEFRARSRFTHSKSNADVWFDAISDGTTYRFLIETKSRVTPQTAISISKQLSAYAQRLPKRTILVLYSSVISPRVAEILREQGISYADRAGNCWLRSPRDHLLIERQGFQAERQPTHAAVDPFSTKSSRIVRAMLSRPMDGWQVRKLAEHGDVGVSVGLAVKVKRTLVEEGYAVERERKLYLRDPLGLLNAWSKEYPGPSEQIPLYFRGDTEVAEQTVTGWCRDNKLQNALSGFSAAWRLAPEVRYTIATIYLEERGFDSLLLDRLTKECNVRRVETGANLYLWCPFDRSVFTSTQQNDPMQPRVTSPLQTYLDLKRADGRGEDAANAIFEKFLNRDLQAAAKHEEERHGRV